MSENRRFIDPYELHLNTMKSVERLPTVRKFLQRPELDALSLLETHIVGHAIGQLLREGEITYFGLNTFAHLEPPVRIYMDDTDDQRDDVARTMLELEQKGLLVFNEEQGTYSLGLDSSPQGK